VNDRRHNQGAPASTKMPNRNMVADNPRPDVKACTVEETAEG